MNPIFNQIPSSREFSKNHSIDDINSVANKASEQLTALCSGISLVGTMLCSLTGEHDETLSKSEQVNLADFLFEAGELIRDFHEISFSYSYEAGMARSNLTK